MRDGEKDYLFPTKKAIDLDVRHVWQLIGAKPFEDEEYDVK